MDGRHHLDYRRQIFYAGIYRPRHLYHSEFVEKRFNRHLKTILAIFWLALFIFVNLTSVLYLGALALETILGIPMMYAIIGLAAFAVIYSLYGGLAAVAWTDVVQVFFLILGAYLPPF